MLFSKFEQPKPEKNNRMSVASIHHLFLSHSTCWRKFEAKITVCFFRLFTHFVCLEKGQTVHYLPQNNGIDIYFLEMGPQIFETTLHELCAQYIILRMCVCISFCMYSCSSAFWSTLSKAQGLSVRMYVHWDWNRKSSLKFMAAING